MNLIWDERLKRFRDPKTGRIVKAKEIGPAAKPRSPNRWSPFEHKEGELLDAVCDRCGKSFKVLYDWRWDDPPREFFCSLECYFQSLKSRESEYPELGSGPEGMEEK